ncbi:defective in cullin neddylation protein 1 [Stachybotrys elegans]|uniref:Defective in cullin neddylation protein n=1 Tax=Stachybotrys elegans TaxID=80388 RepID=A0A8K0SHN9_9HYPO|nr:defective in cullin neddylation protein 1 [Stachybotrys elegans]
MEYFKKLNVSLENAEFFVVQELVQAPSIGEINRKGYVNGWNSAGVGASHEEHAAHVHALIKDLSRDAALFKKVYRYAFITGREREQKSLSLENALAFWESLFSAPGMEWKTRSNDWIGLWKQFLSEKWTRSVNKDMWNMTLEFAVKSLQDETLSFWSEDGAWPSVIDDFVAWCRQRGIGHASESMEVDPVE